MTMVISKDFFFFLFSSIIFFLSSFLPLATTTKATTPECDQNFLSQDFGLSEKLTMVGLCLSASSIAVCPTDHYAITVELRYILMLEAVCRKNVLLGIGEQRWITEKKW